MKPVKRNPDRCRAVAFLNDSHFNTEMKVFAMKRIILLLAVAAMLPLQCKKQGDDTSSLLLLFGALTGNNSNCKNESGLVICIPPGVPAQ
jgi:hypothetical protein